jgi:peptidoglycan-associated lipoprotein
VDALIFVISLFDVRFLIPRMKSRLLLAAVACAALGFASCAKKNHGEDVGMDGDYVTGTPLPDRVEGSNFFGGNVSRGQFESVYFAFDSYTVSDGELMKLDSVAAALKGMKNDIIIAGFTDTAGTEEYNRGLGERRAQAVREALIGLGVSGARIQTVSFGEEMPAATDDKSRRAEFGVIK